MSGIHLVSALGLCALVVGACERKLEKAPGAPALVVAMTKAHEVEWPKVVRVPATISAVDTAQLASRAGGWVTRVDVEAGARVAKGALLAEVGATDARGRLVEAQSRLASAQAALKEAASNERRSRALYRWGDVTAQQYEATHRRFVAATAEAEAAGAGVKVSTTNLDYAEIRAPFAGIVAEKNIRPGDFAAPGATLFVLASGEPQIRAYVGPETFSAVKIGDRAKAVAGGATLTAIVTLASAAADPKTHMHLIELRPEGPIRAPYGAYAELRLTLGRARQLVVPSSALIRRAGLLGAFVVDSTQHAHFRLVRAGRTHDSLVAIEAGLVAGEIVVAAPPSSLENDSPVVAKADAHAAMDGSPR